ncbi:dienelactone hydrolase family protein [Heliobacterium chlorum]|uniref:Dienelactone hydrolase family protein n=1 Tax=Heliobacterium chlorum TaxID=2698 RepID=A0ABR7T424_HELCL|nr:dienelactone hydrolase family protein [Heliobacterium chlorum]MBC9785533.1 dienelactone hydrolase family protein [Heliobacterium chlorum]
MIQYVNNSKSAVVVLHEIYGLNEHIEHVCKQLYELGFDVYAPNMLRNSLTYKYSQEDLAYSNFVTNIGFEKAFWKIKLFLENIKSNYNGVYILGFSVGATIAWLLSENMNLCNGIVGIYGSKIRNFTSTNPSCPVLLVFAADEKSFNVDDLIYELELKDGVEIKKYSGYHGFANPFSEHYQEESARKANLNILQFLLKLSEK